MTAVDTVHGVPRMTGVQARVHLATLALTEDGDVFYLVRDPSEVFLRDGPADSYCLIGLPDDVWHMMAEVGQPGDRVVVLHNTRKYCADPGSEC